MADLIETQSVVVVTREEARAAGLKRYFTGEPCRNGHVSERSTNAGHCLACVYEAKDRHADRSGRQSRRSHGDVQRKAAKAAGEVRYSTGTPCRNGHTAERYTSTGKCVVCEAEKGARWMAERPGLDALWHRERRKKDPTGHRASSKKWATNNPDAVRAILDRWKADHPDRVKELGRVGVANRRTKRLANGGKFTTDDVAEMYHRQEGRCGHPTCCFDNSKLEIDHIMPVDRGGSSDPSNLWLLCLKHNRGKSNRHPVEWAMSMLLDPKLLWPHLSFIQTEAEVIK